MRISTPAGEGMVKTGQESIPGWNQHAIRSVGMAARFPLRGVRACQEDDARRGRWLVAFEVLHFLFMLLGRRSSLERAEVPTLPSLGILLAGIQPILSR